MKACCMARRHARGMVDWASQALHDCMGWGTFNLDTAGTPLGHTPLDVGGLMPASDEFANAWLRYAPH